MAAPRARHGIRLTGPDRAARHHLGERDPHQRHRPLQGLRAGAQARPVPPGAVHLRRHRRPQESRRGRLWPREAQLSAREEGHGREDSAWGAADSRPGEGFQRAGQERRTRQ